MTEVLLCRTCRRKKKLRNKDEDALRTYTRLRFVSQASSLVTVYVPIVRGICWFCMEEVMKTIMRCTNNPSPPSLITVGTTMAWLSLENSGLYWTGQTP